MCHHRVYPGRAPERVSGEEPAEMKKMSIYEYDQEKYTRMERQDAWEKGAEQQLIKIIKNMTKKGRNVSQIAEELGEDETRICELAKNSTE